MFWRIPLLILGFVIFSFGQWMAFEVYSFNKLRKISENTSAFIHGLHRGESSIKIPNPSENIFTLSTREGKLITSNNALTSPLNTKDFTYASYSKDGVQVSTYTRKITLGEYINTFIENPFAFGVSLSGLTLFIVGLVLMVLQAKTSRKLPKETPLQDEELIKSLKALRTTLAMSSVIPKESLEESKRILEDIIKRTEGRQ